MTIGKSIGMDARLDQLIANIRRCLSEQRIEEARDYVYQADSRLVSLRLQSETTEMILRGLKTANKSDRNSWLNQYQFKIMAFYLLTEIKGSLATHRQAS